MKIAAKDLAIDMLFVVDTRLYRVVDILRGCTSVIIDARRQTELGEIPTEFHIPTSHEFDLPEAP